MVQPTEEKAQEDLLNVYKYLRGGTRGNEHELKYLKCPLGTREIFFFNSEGGQTLKQVAQRTCAASICGDTQNPTGHGSWQAAWVDSA